jgi:hypothetical protein
LRQAPVRRSTSSTPSPTGCVRNRARENILFDAGSATGAVAQGFEKLSVTAGPQHYAGTGESEGIEGDSLGKGSQCGAL